MNNQLQTSISLQETAVSNSQKTNSNCSVKKKCYDLFFSCFKNIHKRRPKEDIINHHLNNYDYIVEKLVVKRVPFIVFGIPINTSETNNDNYIKNIQPSLVKMDTVDLNRFKSQSLVHSFKDSTQNMIPANIANNSLNTNTSTIMPNENNKPTLPTDYNTSVLELMNSLTSLHPGLKECERPPKDPCPLIIPINETDSFRNTEEVPSIKRFSSKNNASQKQEMIKSNTHVLESFLSQKEFGDVKSPVIQLKNKQKIYYSMYGTYFSQFQDNYTSNQKKPFIVETDPENSIEKFKQVLSKFQQNQQVLINESKVLGGSITNSNILDTTLRWKIIVKHFKPKQSIQYISEN